MSDKSLAALARRLATALMDFGYSRSPEDKKTVAHLHVELCEAVKNEVPEEPKELT